MKISTIYFTNSNNQTIKPEKQNKKLILKDLSNTEKIYAGLSAGGLIGLTILAIAQKKRINSLNKLTKNKQSLFNPNITQKPVEELLPYKILGLKDNKLYQNFKKSKTSFIEFLKDTKEDAKNVKDFLFSITADKQKSQEFIKEVISDPRKTIANLKILKEKIGGEKNLIEWLQAPQGYQDAYKEYIKALTSKNNLTPEDLLKLSPDWHKHYFETILNCKNNDLHFGKLPKEFEGIGDYSHFAEWINQQNYISKDPLFLEYSGKYMKVTRINNGKSGKIPYLIEFENQETTQKYILKVQQSWGCDSFYAKENLAYKSDSTFMNAQLDYYLTLNNCKNSPKFYYFDYRSNSGLYEFQEGSAVSGVENILDANKRLKDMNLLGIYYNDACSCNFIEQNGTLKVIDIGDSSFIDPLRPGAVGCNLQTPNWCGVGLPNLSMLLKD